MTLTTENILLIGSILLFLSLFAGKTSASSGVPILLLFISIGMLAGSDGIGKIYFDDPKSAQFIGIVALNFILFSGGLDTNWKSIRQSVKPGLTLSTFGVLLTAALVGVFVWAVTDFSFYEGLLLGSIVSSTDSAAVFSILRSRKLALKGNLRPTLELESGSNDPMAYILTLASLGLVLGEKQGIPAVFQFLIQQLVVGGLLGYVFGRIGKLVINRIRLDYEGLYIVLMIAIMFFSFSFTDFIGGNGFLAVYVTALYLGNQELIHKKKFLKSFDSFAWLMQIVMFLTLGLLVYPSQLIQVAGIGLLVSLFLIIIARPAAVFLSLVPFRFPARNKWFISWVGLRGAVPIVFATYPLLAGIEKAQMIFNIVFFISLTSVLIQGTSLPLVARLLHLTLPANLKQRTVPDLELSETVKSSLTQVVIDENCSTAGMQIVELGFPKTTSISFIQRGEKYITPNGSTVIQPGDILYILSENPESLGKAMECLRITNN